MLDVASSIVYEKPSVLINKWSSNANRAVVASYLRKLFNYQINQKLLTRSRWSKSKHDWCEVDVGKTFCLCVMCF